MADRRYTTRRWRTLREQALVRDGYHCVKPACTNPGPLAVDHIWEVADGGPFWSLDNLQTLCDSHHKQKTNLERARRLVANTQLDPVSPHA